jgi:probable HAF family extracellular repeat protein
MNRRYYDLPAASCMGLILMMLLLAAPSLQAQQASFTGLGFVPGGTRSSANAVSPDGRVVVGHSSGPGGQEAFRWEDGVMTGLGDLPGGIFSSIAMAASFDGGVIVGQSSGASGWEAFRWENGVMTGLGDLPGGGFESRANDVSYDGAVVVGIGRIAQGTPPDAAFRWEDGNMLQLPTIPGGLPTSYAVAVSGDGSIVGGTSLIGGGSMRATRWVGGEGVSLGVPPGMSSSRTNDLSTDGSVVVGSAFGPGTRGFIWYEGEGFTLLEHLPGGIPYSEAWCVSGDGQVVAGTTISASGSEVFLWTRAGGMRSLRGTLEDDYGLDLGDWVLQGVQPGCLSYDGTVIAGPGFNPDGEREGWRAVLPGFVVQAEPGAGAQRRLWLSAAPNPFSDRTTLRFVVPEAGHVSLKVYDVLGREVAAPFEGQVPAGQVQQVALQARDMAPGVYLVRLAAPGYARTLRVVRLQ